jgi:hypothetical protein
MRDTFSAALKRAVKQRCTAPPASAKIKAWFRAHVDEIDRAHTAGITWAALYKLAIEHGLPPYSDAPEDRITLGMFQYHLKLARWSRHRPAPRLVARDGCA